MVPIVAELDLAPRIDAVRRFNRFYTRNVGALNEGLLESRFSLTEARVLYELAHRELPTASELGKVLGLDAGYLSRILGGFRKQGLVGSQPSQADGRQSLLALTESGRAAFEMLDARARKEIAEMLGRLPEPEQRRLIAAMHAIGSLLGAPEQAEAADKRSYLLRPHQPGDMGWVVGRHGALYAQEYGWDEQFEGLVAGIVAEFLKRYDPKRERCWIAEQDGENVGSVFLVQHSKTVAQLRLLLVEPRARGLGIGARLVSECVRCARQLGYRKITLWTQSVLHAARHLYERAGFELGQEQPHRSFGKDLVGETWELKLTPGA